MIESLKEGAKIQALMGILADVDAGKHDFSVASIRETLSFTHNVLERSAPFMPSGERDDAEATHRAASVLDLKQGAGGIRLCKVWEFEVTA